jgi:hypothetical protein
MRLASAVVVLSLAALFWSTPASAMMAQTCVYQVTTTQVCYGDGTCGEPHIYWDAVCYWFDSGGSGAPIPDQNGDSGGYTSQNPYDSNGDGIVDNWHSVVNTSHPCSYNFSNTASHSDRLGTNYGGPGTARPDHHGVDIQAYAGEMIYPAKDGRVESIGEVSGCGYRVQIANFDGTHYSYCHMQTGSALVSVGSNVFAGFTRIGGVDNTGSSNGDHLHITALGSDYQIIPGWEYFTETSAAASTDDNGC